MRGAGGSTAARESSVSAGAERVADERVVDEHRRYLPGEPLRRYVAGYTGYRQRGLPPARHRGLPSPYLTLIFTLDEPLSIEAHPDPGQPPGEFRALLGGLHSAPALIRQRIEQKRPNPGKRIGEHHSWSGDVLSPRIRATFKTKPLSNAEL